MSLFAAILVGGSFLVLAMMLVQALATPLQKVERRDAWRAAAAVLGFQVRGGGEEVLEGEMDRLRIRVSRVPWSERIDEPDVTRITVQGDVAFSKGLRIPGAPMPTGDSAFDDRLHVHGYPGDVLTILDAETRRALLAVSSTLWEQGWRLHVPDNSPAELRLERQGIVTTSEHLVEVVRAAVALAPRLAIDPGRRVAALAARMEDANPHVRARVLETLLRHYATSTSALDAAAGAALHDPSLHVRGLAAGYLVRRRADVPDATRILARVVTEPTLPDDLRESSFEFLERHATDCARDLIPVLLDGPHGSLRAVAVRAAGRLQVHALAPRLAGMVHDPPTRVRIEVARALGLLGGPAAEPALVMLLRASNDEIRAAALSALQRIGTRDALILLVEMEADGTRGDDERHRARTAISAIRSRLGPADSGRVSITGNGSGEISVAPAVGGAISPASVEPRDDG